MRRCRNDNIAERDKHGHCLCTDCKKDRAAYQIKWKLSNKERVLENSRRWKLENKDKVREYCRKRRKKNPDKIRENNRVANKKLRDKNPERYKEVQREANKNWVENNRGIVNAKNAKRHATKLKATPKWANMDKIKLFYIEAARLTKETGIKHHVDHIIPLQGRNICGLHVENNLQILTAYENCSKSNKLLI